MGVDPRVTSCPFVVRTFVTKDVTKNAKGNPTTLLVYLQVDKAARRLAGTRAKSATADAVCGAPPAPKCAALSSEKSKAAPPPERLSALRAPTLAQSQFLRTLR
jgi:hypothetical protein